jgi:glucokinase
MKIGLDLGGTKIMAGLIDETGKITNLYAERSKANGSKQTVIEQVESLIERFFSDKVSMIGIGVPAIVDSEKGIVYDTVSIPSWDVVPLKQILEERFKVPARVNNDCNCFASGILNSPNFEGYDDMVCITLGTGVGSGLIFGRHLYTGKDSLAGEIGSIHYMDKDFENYCGSRFFTSRGLTGKRAFDSAEAGDIDVMGLWNEYGHHLGNLIQTVLYAYNPQAIVLGGSISNAYKYFKDSMMSCLSSFAYKNVIRKLTVTVEDTATTMIIGATSDFK